MKKYDIGYYWICLYGVWSIGMYDGKKWSVIGVPDRFDTGDLGIGDKITFPEKYCVLKV